MMAHFVVLVAAVRMGVILAEAVYVAAANGSIPGATVPEDDVNKVATPADDDLDCEWELADCHQTACRVHVP